MVKIRIALARIDYKTGCFAHGENYTVYLGSRANTAALLTAYTLTTAPGRCILLVEW